jgi:CheY-like chemotaxis protein
VKAALPEGRLQILVIEDNPADVELLRLALAEAGLVCDLTVIVDGAAALALILQMGEEERAPHLAILDLNLPKHDGLEILEKIRATRSLTTLPIVILSSSSSPRDRARIEKFGVGRYLVKPPSLDEFLRIGLVVKELLSESL